jgi:hypothetical protein
MSNFKNKYFKYKSKYLQLKILKGGIVHCDRAYNNILGTCWAVALQTIFTFGQATSNILESIMNSFHPLLNKDKDKDDIKDEFIILIMENFMRNEELRNFFPGIISRDSYETYIYQILDKFINRYYSKVFEFNFTEKPIGLDAKINKDRCEFIIADNFKKLFDFPIMKLDESPINFGGSIIETYLFANLLTIYFLGYKVSFTKYTDKFNSINFDTENDLGILISIEGHICCLYICNCEQKYYNNCDKRVYDCKWIDLLKESSENNLYIEKGRIIKRINDIESYEGDIKKVLYLIVITKYIPNNSLDIEIINALKLIELDEITDSEIQTDLGLLFYKGIIGKPDFSGAQSFFLKGAAQGDANAQYMTALIYEKKLAFDPYDDDKDDEYFYRLAASKGHTAAIKKVKELDKEDR